MIHDYYYLHIGNRVTAHESKLTDCEWTNVFHWAELGRKKVKSNHSDNNRELYNSYPLSLFMTSKHSYYSPSMLWKTSDWLETNLALQSDERIYFNLKNVKLSSPCILFKFTSEINACIQPAVELLLSPSNPETPIEQNQLAFISFTQSNVFYLSSSIKISGHTHPHFIAVIISFPTKTRTS